MTKLLVAVAWVGIAVSAHADPAGSCAAVCRKTRSASLASFKTCVDYCYVEALPT
jgi:hypothetical protein